MKAAFFAIVGTIAIFTMLNLNSAQSHRELVVASQIASLQVDGTVTYKNGVAVKTDLGFSQMLALHMGTLGHVTCNAIWR